MIYDPWRDFYLNDIQGHIGPMLQNRKITSYYVTLAVTSAEILGERQSWMWGIRELGILGARDQEGKAGHEMNHNMLRNTTLLDSIRFQSHESIQLLVGLKYNFLHFIADSVPNSKN